MSGAVLIERLTDGTVRTPEGIDTEAGRNARVGGLVGSLVGVLAGPLGVLMDWGIGALIGGGHDYKKAALAVGVVSAVSAVTPHVPRGGTVILAEVGETDPQVLDRLAMRYDAILERRSADSVRDELKAMEEAADQARKEQAKRKREHKHAERKATRGGGAMPTPEATA
ncbi:hypothetical protein [Streptomyces sp. NPDC051677]|uniref:hypothetical protein n=1 Tax=Streptomyces sp. NPDC051677 TaxID=3365669 RepID=UPI0037D21FF1